MFILFESINELKLKPDVMTGQVLFGRMVIFGTLEKINMKKNIGLILIFASLSFRMLAEEGMLIPSLIAAFESDMKAKGMKLSASDIYSVNNSSLKDAIMHFGGGCTAELVSSKGLLLTNHHCGYSQIQSHSSLEKDYLKYGFWAKDLSEELPNPGLTASRNRRAELKTWPDEKIITNNKRGARPQPRKWITLLPSSPSDVAAAPTKQHRWAIMTEMNRGAVSTATRARREANDARQ